jgi:hypothetical protein
LYRRANALRSLAKLPARRGLAKIGAFDRGFPMSAFLFALPTLLCAPAARAQPARPSSWIRARAARRGDRIATGRYAMQTRENGTPR